MPESCNLLVDQTTVSCCTMSERTATNPCARNPLSLEKCSQLALLRHLRKLCQSEDYDNNKRHLKHFLKFEFPPSVRQQLINELLSQSRLYSSIDVNLFEVLLSPCVREVRVAGVRSFYQDRFATVLRQSGVGLETLYIEDNSWGSCRHHMNLALSHLRHLRWLSLRYVATDSMLHAIANSCEQLQELDVTGSHQVTDGGISFLARPSTAENVEGLRCSCHGKTHNRKLSFPVNTKSNSSGKTHFFPKLFKNFRRHSVNQLTTETASLQTRQLEPNYTSSVPGFLEHLCVIVLTGTSVTTKGIKYLSAYEPKLQIVVAS